MDKDKAGREGEQRAAELLLSKGYKILAKNWRGRCGEIDIVAYEGGEIVFVEVKARSSEEKGSALEAVDADKRRRLARAAKEFLARKRLEGRPCRFDVVAVKLSGSSESEELIKGAFFLED